MLKNWAAAIAAGILGCLTFLVTTAPLTTAQAESFASEAELDRFINSVKLANDQIMFIVKSRHPNIVDLEFYSDDRRVAWPGDNKVYTLKDSHWHTYVLNCRRGEKICYGAGVRGKYDSYWGVGINRRARCEECCYRCDGVRSKLITLNP